MKAYDPQVITGVEGSHCLIQLYGWDMYIDAKKERPGQIVNILRGLARDAII